MTPKLKTSPLTHWLPSPGSLLFTLLIAALLYAHQVNAFPAPNSNSPTQTQTSSTTTLPYQGRLTDSNGNPINATKAMTFRLYNVASGGTALWQEAWPAVQVSDGLFNVLLGSTTLISPALFAENNSLWLGITVGTDTEMTPRVQVGSVPFTFQASRAYGLSAADGNPQDAVYVDANGNVGIGTTNPSTLLDINQGNTSNGILWERAGWDTIKMGIFGTGFSVENMSDSRVDLVISGNGDVGIGTDPGQKLDVLGNIQNYGVIDTLGPNEKLRLTHSSGINYIQSGDISFTSNAPLYLTGPNGITGSALAILYNNVGIGTADPQELLHIEGATPGLRFRDTDAAPNRYWNLSVEQTSGQESDLIFSNAGGAGPDPRVIFQFDGDVGIGTVDPQHKLDVVGDIYASGIICANNGSACLPAPSDLRLKTNITLLTHPLDKLTQLRGVTFDWNDEATALGLSGETAHIGVIAQEVEAVFPEMVTTMDNGYKAVDYSEFSAVLIEAIKELRAEKDGEIASLKADNTALQEQVTSLDARLTALEHVQSGQPVHQANGWNLWGWLLLGVGAGWFLSSSNRIRQHFTAKATKIAK